VSSGRPDGAGRLRHRLGSDGCGDDAVGRMRCDRTPALAAIVGHLGRPDGGHEARPEKAWHEPGLA
jgi:hypothetical protein